MYLNIVRSILRVFREKPNEAMKICYRRYNIYFVKSIHNTRGKYGINSEMSGIGDIVVGTEHHGRVSCVNERSSIFYNYHIKDLVKLSIDVDKIIKQ